MSFICKVIIKQGSIVQPIAAVLDLNTDIVKDDSASANPVTNQGFNLISGRACIESPPNPLA